MQTSASGGAWAVFETWLVSVRPGYLISVDQAVARTGMPAESVQLVLDTLTRAGLFEQHERYFLRLGSSS